MKNYYCRLELYGLTTKNYRFPKERCAVPYR